MSDQQLPANGEPGANHDVRAGQGGRESTTDAGTNGLDGRTGDSATTAASRPAVPDDEDSEDSEDAEAGATAGRSRRLVSSTALIIGLCALLGFAFVTQVHSNSSQSSLSTARQGDLVQILDDLSSKQTRVNNEIGQLQQTRDKIASGESSQAALTEARTRATELGVLAGTIPATGTGLVITITQVSDHIPAELLLDTLEELRGAGAEAVQISAGGASVRLVASSYFLDNGDGIRVDGTLLKAPYTVTAIGGPATMKAALNIPGGVTDTIVSAHGTIAVAAPNTVRVSALRHVVTPQYARPAS